MDQIFHDCALPTSFCICYANKYSDANTHIVLIQLCKQEVTQEVDLQQEVTEEVDLQGQVRSQVKGHEASG